MPVSYLHNSAPDFGQPTEVARGIWWLRLPISLAMNHVNVYLLEDGDGWTLIDAGCNTEECRTTFLAALAMSPFCDRPIKNVLVTHFHPDHVGMAGYFTGGEDGAHSAKLFTSQTCWHSTRLLRMDNPATPYAEHVEFMQLAGMKGMELESFKRRPPSSYAAKVAPLPARYNRVHDHDELRIGDREWKVRMGFGHADEHITLWSDDDIAIVGDQILPAISPNLSVHFSLPTANCVMDWMCSCDAFTKIASESTLCLPGHNRPFTGAPVRCEQLIENCQQVMSRIKDSLSKPKTAMELMPDIYRRDLAPYEKALLIGETMGYLNFMLYDGRVTRKLSSHGSWLWRRAPSFRKSPMKEKR